MEELLAKKSLGQHWLRDEQSLKEIVRSAEVSHKDTVLEIGPGLGTLTRELVKTARKVVAVELDEVLARRLASDLPVLNLVVRNQDIMKFNLGELPVGYKVVANIPYYLTGNILRMLTDSANPPKQMVLLVQKEVAQRLAAGPGQLSIIAVATQLHYQVKLGKVIKAELFAPPPKVDSQVVILQKRNKPLFKNLNKNLYLRVVKAGFSLPRKKLRSSLAAGLVLEKGQVDELLHAAKISGDLRPQNLTLEQWHKIYKELVI